MSVKFYQAQTYRERELLIVLNTHDADMTEVEAARKGDDSIKLLQTPADMPVGCAVNLGILNMSGDYWAKMDDDDYYSPNYLADINLYRKAVDFDIAGKGALFNYLEAEDATIVRSWKQADRQTHNFAGGTLVVKNTPENVHWPENVRGYADIEFLTQRLTKGAHISSLDPFSHIQIRRSDSTFHTWTRQAVHANAAFVSDGLSVESVFI
jgi:glycosyltransferase involved in cell wall biosynthesis